MARAFEAMTRALMADHPEDGAKALEAIGTEDAVRIIKTLPKRTAADVLEHLAPGPGTAILGALGAESAVELLESLSPRKATSLLHSFEDAAREAALGGFDPEAARRIRALLHYPEDTAGALMDTRVTTLQADLSVAEAIAKLRRSKRETLFYLYVTSEDGILEGVVNMRELLLAPPRSRLAPLVHRDIVSVQGTATRAELTELIRQRRFVAIPVVDSQGYFLGVVRKDELLSALEEEAFGDLQKMVGAGEDERALSPVDVVVRKRLPWLYVNLATAFLAAAVVGVFEGTIERVTALAVLLPVVAGQGGNTGAQALAVVMRGMALDELVPGTERRLLWKEGAGAFLNGALVALGTSVGVYVWDGRLALAMVIGLAMVVNMTAAGLAGASIPLVLRRLGLDPAQSSSIVLTTVTDIVGFAAFLGFASIFMSLLV